MALKGGLIIRQDRKLSACAHPAKKVGPPAGSEEAGSEVGGHSLGCSRLFPTHLQ